VATNEKVAFRVTLLNIANVEPRETVIATVAAADVAAAFASLKAAAEQAKGRIVVADLSEQDKQKPSASLQFYIRRAEDSAMQKAVNEAGDVLSRNVARAAQSENVADQKITYKIDIVSSRAIEPRETLALGVEVSDVDGEVSKFVAQVKKLGGRIVKGPETAQSRSGKMIARVVADVPVDVRDDVVEKLKSHIRGSRSTPNPSAPEGKMATVRIDVTISNEALDTKDDTVATPFQSGISGTLGALWMSVRWLLTGILFVLPFAVVVVPVVWLMWKFWWKAEPQMVRPVVATAAGPVGSTPPPASSAP
jgi:hypothetical protein